MPDEPTLVFIDAGYLSKISKHFGGGKHVKLNLIQFSLSLAQKQNLSCEHIFYYTAPPFQSNPSTPHENILKAGYDSFIRIMKQNSLITVREGRLQKLEIITLKKGWTRY